jgi:hypothetical protein
MSGNGYDRKTCEQLQPILEAMQDLTGGPPTDEEIEQGFATSKRCLDLNELREDLALLYKRMYEQGVRDPKKYLEMSEHLFCCGRDPLHLLEVWRDTPFYKYKMEIMNRVCVPESRGSAHPESYCCFDSFYELIVERCFINGMPVEEACETMRMAGWNQS